MEFLGFKKHTEKSFQKSSKFLEHAEIIGIDDEIVENVIALRRKKKMKLPDAIIAATAMKNNWTLITRNEDDFKDTGLIVYNPFSESGI